MTQLLRPRTRVCVLHSGKANPAVVAGPKQLGLRTSYDLHSFTDRHPAENRYNVCLVQRAMFANIIVIEQGLLEADTLCVRGLRSAMASSPTFERLLVFSGPDGPLRAPRIPRSLSSYPAYTQSDKRALGITYRKRFTSFKKDAAYMAEVAFRAELAGIAALDVTAEEFASRAEFGMHPELRVARREHYFDQIRILREHTDARARGIPIDEESQSVGETQLTLI